MQGARIRATTDRWPEGHEKLLAPGLYGNANPSKKLTPQRHQITLINANATPTTEQSS